MKPLLGTKSTKKCPECGGDTVIERHQNGTKLRRCDELVETHMDKPLQPCEWAEEIHGNGKTVKEKTWK